MTRVATRSAEWYVKYNDFEGALERFNDTNARWKRYWFDTCETIFNQSVEWAKKYVLDPICLTIKKVETVIQKVIKETVAHTKLRHWFSYVIPMNYLAGCGEDVAGQQTVYLFKFYGANHKIIFSKIGTTSVSVDTRLRQEIGEYMKKFDIVSVDVCKIYDCGNLPAESFESFLRATLIKKFPNTWYRNDRFFDVDIPVETFTSLCDTFANI